MNTCTRHGRYRCTDSACTRDRNDNLGDLSIGVNTGDLNIGLGNGLTLDVADGDLGIQIAPGISVDF